MAHGEDAPMRILLWHGYLLGGTGSNVYTRALAREWSRAGHEVVVFSQEPSPEQYDLGGAQSVRPDIGRLLPVFVLDHYEGFDARRLPDLSAAEREQYVAANAAVLREHLPADLVCSGVKIIFNYNEALLDVPHDVAVHTSNPAVELLHALYFHLT